MSASELSAGGRPARGATTGLQNDRVTGRIGREVPRVLVASLGLRSELGSDDERQLTPGWATSAEATAFAAPLSGDRQLAKKRTSSPWAADGQARRQRVVAPVLLLPVWGLDPGV
jgi:hypothetical protein